MPPAALTTQGGDLSRGHDPPRGQDHHLVAEPLDELELVAGEQHGDAGCGQLAEQFGEAVDRDGVEAAERLVEQQQVRVVDQGCRDLGALLVAQREGVDLVVGALAEVEPFEQLVAAPGSGGRLDAVQASEVDELPATDMRG